MSGCYLITASVKKIFSQHHLTIRKKILKGWLLFILTVLVKTASKSYRKNPTNTNARKLEKAQYQLAGIYLKEQVEYIQN